MLRPTPGRLIYLLVGLVIGAIALVGYTAVAPLPSFIPVSRSAAEQPKVPTEFSGATLSRVVSANQTASAGGVTVRVNALELYGDGFSFTYSVLSGQPGEPAPVLQPESFAVVDDLGGSYRLSALGSAASVGPGVSVGYLTFTPALNPEAKTLTLSVPHLMVLSGASDVGTSRVVDGPWKLAVPLR